MIQFFVKYGMNGGSQLQTFTASVDVNPQKTAKQTSDEILKEVLFIHNEYYDTTLSPDDILIHVLTRLN